MSDRETTRTTGNGSAILTTNGAQSPANVDITHCDKIVPRASDSIYGKCNYYYEPMMFGKIETIEKSWPAGSEPPTFPGRDGVSKSGISTGELLGQFIEGQLVPLPLTMADNFKMLQRALRWQDELLDPESNVGWSRYGNFWARHVNCGHIPPDYYTHYGYYYCSRYAEYLHPRLSPRGQKWMADARYNLQVYLDDAIQANMKDGQQSIVIRQAEDETVIQVSPYELELESEKFRQAAFATHVNAYLDAGLSELPLTDLYKISTMPNFEEWLDGATWDQAYKSGKSVLSDWGDSAAEGISDAWDGATGQAAEWADRALERLTGWY